MMIPIVNQLGNLDDLIFDGNFDGDHGLDAGVSTVMAAFSTMCLGHMIP